MCLPETDRQSQAKGQCPRPPGRPKWGQAVARCTSATTDNIKAQANAKSNRSNMVQQTEKPLEPI